MLIRSFNVKRQIRSFRVLCGSLEIISHPLGKRWRSLITEIRAFIRLKAITCHPTHPGTRRDGLVEGVSLLRALVGDLSGVCDRLLPPIPPDAGKASPHSPAALCGEESC